MRSCLVLNVCRLRRLTRTRKAEPWTSSRAMTSAKRWCLAKILQFSPAVGGTAHPHPPSEVKHELRSSVPSRPPFPSNFAIAHSASDFHFFSGPVPRILANSSQQSLCTKVNLSPRGHVTGSSNPIEPITRALIRLSLLSSSSSATVRICSLRCYGTDVRSRS